MTSRSSRRSLVFPLFILVLTLGLAFPTQAEIQTEVRDYRVGDTALRGYLAWDDSVPGQRPGVLVVHEWWGHNDYARQRAEQLAAEGFTAFALDLYGVDRTTDHPEDAKRFMEALLADLPEAQRRFEAALELLRSHDSVDPDKTASIGYCLGGGLSLYMGRIGADLDAVVSFHGALGLASQVSAAPAGGARVPMLVFTGGADPMIPADQVSTFVSAMLSEDFEVSVTSYPGVQHSFTVPGATERGRATGMPLVYDAHADSDSWRRTLSFLEDRLMGKSR